MSSSSLRVVVVDVFGRICFSSSFTFTGFAAAVADFLSVCLTYFVSTSSSEEEVAVVVFFASDLLVAVAVSLFLVVVVVVVVPAVYRLRGAAC